MGFGEKADLERTVESVDWIDAPDVSTLVDGIEQGEDVVVLRLASDAPPGTVPTPIAFDYVPAGSDLISVAGFGAGSADGEAGARRLGTGRPVSFDSTLGTVQLDGVSACTGDSGGPLLLPDGRLVGVIGTVSPVSDGGSCGIGVTSGATVANEKVRAFLQKECAEVAGCGPLVVAAEAGGAEISVLPQDAQAPSVPTPRDAGNHSVEAGIAKHLDAVGGCSLRSPLKNRNGDVSLIAWLFAFRVFKGRLRRKR